MKFKTTAQIYKALLSGKRLRKSNFSPKSFVYLKDGMVVNHQDIPSLWGFSDPEKWSIHRITAKNSNIEVKEVKIECFYDVKNGKMYEIEVGTKAHNYASLNRSLIRAESRDRIKKVPIEESE